MVKTVFFVFCKIFIIALGHFFFLLYYSSNNTFYVILLGHFLHVVSFYDNDTRYRICWLHYNTSYVNGEWWENKVKQNKKINKVVMVRIYRS